MAFRMQRNILFLTILSTVQLAQGVPVPGPNPKPQVLPGQIPPHLASHPALSSVTQGRESALMQYAYNIQNRRGPNPSPLVLQNNQERNLQLVNQLSQQRSGQSFIPSNGGQIQQGQHGGHSHSTGTENPELRAFDLLQQYKGQGSPGQTQQNSYNPSPLTPHGPAQYNSNNNNNNYPSQIVGPSGAPPHVHSHGDENEGEDIRRLKSILNISGRPIGTPAPNYGSPGSPTIGVAGERGVLNPSQYGQNHHHDHAHHHHPTPIPATSQSQHSLGSLQYGQSPRPPYYSGSGGPTAGPSGGVHVPYGADGHHHHGHDHHNHGQDAQTLIQSLETPPEEYRNLVYIDPVREPTSINKHIGPSQSVFILPASDYTSDDYQRLLNRPAEILIDVIPSRSSESNGKGQDNNGNDFALHNFSLHLSPSTYARCAQATHKRGYGGKCKLILRVGKKGTSGTQPVQVSY